MDERYTLRLSRAASDRMTGCADRMEAARAIVDAVAAECGLSDPAHAFWLLSESEQARLYSLLKGNSR